MKREIKFRAWHNEKMFYEKDFADANLGIASRQSQFWHNVHPNSSFMQFTGLHDKNGKEIYEGDIYHMGDPKITYTVFWRDSGLIGKQNSSSSYAGFEYWKERIEIIGNIYQNPELINSK